MCHWSAFWNVFQQKSKITSFLDVGFCLEKCSCNLFTTSEHTSSPQSLLWFLELNFLFSLCYFVGQYFLLSFFFWPYSIVYSSPNNGLWLLFWRVLCYFSHTSTRILPPSSPPFTSTAIIPPKDLICFLAMSWWGWDSRPGYATFAIW